MRIAAVFCLCLFFAGAPFCPGQELGKIAGIRHVTRDVHNRPVPARRQGNSIWNNAAVGDWVTGSRVRFLMEKDGSLLPAWLLASSQYAMHYVPGLDLTVLVKPPLLGTMAMIGGGLTDSAASPDSAASCAVDVGPAIAGMRIYFQGAVRGLGQIYPADMSNGVYSN